MQRFNRGFCRQWLDRFKTGWVCVLLTFALIAGLNTQVAAQLRCDCRQLLGECEASASYKEGLLEVTSNTAACSQVLYYVDGQPQVRLVTDGRDVEPASLNTAADLQVGSCQVCQAVHVSEQQKQQVVRLCEADYLMPTAETKQCLSSCDALNAKEKAPCENRCQRFSRCLDKTCVQSLRQKLSRCEKRCDRDMQSSMAADIDAYRVCQEGCAKIKQEILTCPVI